MKKSIQDKLDAIEKLAKASALSPSPKKKKVSAGVSDSLSKAIRTQKDADIFMAELDALIELARRR